MFCEFTDTLTARDFKRHIPHTFTVPENCTRLSIRFGYAPPRVGDIRNMLTLTLFDPDGFRGAGHRHGDVHEIELTAATELARHAATPGYRPGPLPAGEWTVQIDTHMILPGADCPYTLKVKAETLEVETVEVETVTAETGADSTGAVDMTTPGGTPDFDYVAQTAPGWYRGDLHAHTFHSDAAWDVPDLLAAARAMGLDFVTLTDHNTTSALGEFAQQSAPELLTMGGMELTTFWGHAVCLGTAHWIDWRVDMEGQAMNRIAQERYAADQIFVIAHPQDEGDPLCTGCRWVYPQMRPGAARYVEVWNGRWESTDPRTKNEGSLGLWYDWLNQGLRLTATAGSDAHGPAHYGERTNRGCVGFNVIYAQELSQRGILDGLRRGQSYLSAGPVLQFSAQDAAGRRAEIGGELAAQQNITLQSAWTDAPTDARVRLVCRGEIVDERSAEGAGEASWKVDGEPGQWFVLELRRDDGWMLGLTNPIFFE